MQLKLNFTLKAPATYIRKWTLKFIHELVFIYKKFNVSEQYLSLKNVNIEIYGNINILDHFT